MHAPLTIGRPHPARHAHPHGLPHIGSGDKLTPDQKHAELTEQAGKWVAQTFFGQMLKLMRESPFKSKMFDGGHGGEAFQQMADQRTADGMARGSGRKLVDAIVRQIEGRHAYAPVSPRPRDRGVA